MIHKKELPEARPETDWFLVGLGFRFQGFRGSGVQGLEFRVEGLFI